MNWVTDTERAEELLLQAGTCKWIDSRRGATSLQCLSFDDAFICTEYFYALLCRLMKLSTDDACHYIVLDPDPKQYFLRHFKKLPVVEISARGKLEQYLAILNEDPGDSPADAVGTNCYEWVIVPPSHRWFVHCLRSADNSGGHLWLPRKWVADAEAAYSGLTYPAVQAANDDSTWPA